MKGIDKMKNYILGALIALITTFGVNAYSYEAKVCKMPLQGRLEAYINELKIERARLIPLCFRRGEDAEQLEIAEYCGNFSQIDIVIHYLSKEIH